VRRGVRPGRCCFPHPSTKKHSWSLFLFLPFSPTKLRDGKPSLPPLQSAPEGSSAVSTEPQVLPACSRERVRQAPEHVVVFDSARRQRGSTVKCRTVLASSSSSSFCCRCSSGQEITLPSSINWRTDLVCRTVGWFRYGACCDVVSTFSLRLIKNKNKNKCI
jgi:hypothetical protein